MDRVISAYEFSIEVAARGAFRKERTRVDPLMTNTKDVWPWSVLVRQCGACCCRIAQLVRDDSRGCVWHEQSGRVHMARRIPALCLQVMQHIASNPLHCMLAAMQVYACMRCTRVVWHRVS